MQIPNNRLTYTLHSAFAGDRTVVPMGESAFKVRCDIHDIDNDPLYDYIYTFNGTLIFNGDDYNWIKALEDDVLHRGDDLFLEITDVVSGTILPGTRLILNDGIWDLDKCTVDIVVSSPDLYLAYNRKKADELDFFDLLVSGSFYDINTLDYIPQFETNYSEIVPPGTGAFDISVQNFRYFPDSKAQYPGYGPDGEVPDPHFPSAATRLFESVDLIELTNNAVDGYVELNVGTKPYHNGYANADLAVADGWRLYAYRFDIFNNPGSGSAMGYKGMFAWIREVKDIVIGTAMTPEWVYVGVVGGLDRWARKPLLVPRMNINRSAFRTEAFPGEAQVRLMQNTYVVGLDIANIVAGSSYPGITAPVTPIVDVIQDQEYKNYYSFEAITNGKKLNDVIEFAVAHCDPTLTVKSDFFQINPFTVSTTNYVTGLDSFVNDIIMLQKTDVKRAFATNKATKGPFTTEKLMFWLNQMFNVKFRIEGLNFVIEHVSSPFFVRAATMDLTASPLNKMLAGLRRYSYEQKNLLPGKETFAFMEARPQGASIPLDDFTGVPIIYYGSNVDRTKENGLMAHQVDSVTTDIYYIFIHSGGIGYLIDQTTKNPFPVQNAADDNTISDDGFCMIATKVVVSGFTSERYLIVADPILSANREMNNVLGWAHLHDAFFRQFRNTSHGELNNVATTFDSTKYIKKSVNLPFVLCNYNDFDPFELIVNALGSGLVKSAEYSIKDSVMTVILGFQE